MYYTTKEVYEFIALQNKDPIVHRKKCAKTGNEFAIYQSDIHFYKKISPIIDGEVQELSLPTLCPEERQRRRMSWRNERYLFRRKCDATWKDIISMYPPSAKFPVYTEEVRRSDSWSGLDYGFEFDHNKTFTEQFKVLLDTVPRLFMYNLRSENSDYCNCCSDMKNCYLVTAWLGCEDCYYWSYMYHCTDSIDNFMVFSSSRMYECVECTNCENCKYAYNIHNCSNTMFMMNCDNCHNCFGCVNQVGKSYCWFNEQLSKEDYEEKLTNLDMWSRRVREEMGKKFETFSNTFPRSSNVSINAEKCVANYSVTKSKNCSFCFDVNNLEDCKYAYRYRWGKDCYDVFSRGTRWERMYECTQTGDNVSNCIGCVAMDSESHYCYYSTTCSWSKYLFGCNWLKNAEYCIFNKQYSKKDREKEVKKIVQTMKKTGEWWEMLNPVIGIFGYNHTLANEFLSITKQEAEKIWYRWDDYHVATSQVGRAVNSRSLWDSIQEVPSDIGTRILVCEKSKKQFRITRQELEFYKKYNIPLPTDHVDERFLRRLKMRPARELHVRRCDKTQQKIVTVFPQETPFPVWEESMYKESLYW